MDSKRLIHISDMIRPFVVGIIPRIDTCSAEMLQQQTVAIFLVLIFCAYQATNFFLAKTELLSADGCYATELRVLRRETQKLKPVISHSHCFVYPAFLSTRTFDTFTTVDQFTGSARNPN